MAVPAGEEWSPPRPRDRCGRAGGLHQGGALYLGRIERHAAEPVAVPAELPQAARRFRLDAGGAFGRIMGELAKSELPLARRIVTTSPDVTVSTSLGGWVGRLGVFGRSEREDVFRSEQVVSPTPLALSSQGQHLELGTENNLFLNLASLGLRTSCWVRG
ncbi:MAG: hypothetical protein U1E17_18410 [Geminicoccaceae bacterium]